MLYEYIFEGLPEPCVYEQRSVKRKIIDLEKCTEIYIYFYIYFAVCVNWARSVSVFVIRSESQLRKIAVFVAQVAV